MENTATAVPTTPATSPRTEQPFLLTPGAVAQVKQVMTREGMEGFVLSVRVVPAGCSGLGYDLNLVKESQPGDTTWAQDGLTLATDAMSTKYLAGTEIDYLTTATSAGFKFNNPNARSTCGCGTSFSA